LRAAVAVVFISEGWERMNCACVFVIWWTISIHY
jgi:hypothetical protein